MMVLLAWALWLQPLNALIRNDELSLKRGHDALQLAGQLKRATQVRFDRAAAHCAASWHRDSQIAPAICYLDALIFFTDGGDDCVGSGTGLQNRTDAVGTIDHSD